MEYGFCKKYNPTSISNIIGNKQQIGKIKTWLSQYDKNKESFLRSNVKKKKKKNAPKTVDISENETENETENIVYSTSYQKNTNNIFSCLLIIGEHGIGKSCSAIAVLNELNFNYYQVVLTKIKTSKNVLDNVNKLLKNRNIIDKSNNNTQKFAVIVDDVESANSPIEKNFIITLLKQNEENWHCPLIFISSGKHSKIVSVLKKNSNVIYFNKPTSENLMLSLTNVYKEEGLYFADQEVANKIISISQHDYRKLLTCLQDLKNEFGDKKITIKDLNKFCNNTKTKDIDVEIFKATSELLTNYKNINECLRLYESEKVIIPLMVHQNYTKCIGSGNIESIELINKISKSLAFGDLIENYVFSEQNWDMYEIHGFFSCINPSFKLKNQQTNNEYFTKSLEFPLDFNKTSIKKINKRNIINSSNCFKNLNIDDFVYASKLTRDLINEQRFEECANLYSDYDTKIENIESLLKIDKITDTKTTQNKIFIAQNKKKLLELLG